MIPTDHENGTTYKNILAWSSITMASSYLTRFRVGATDLDPLLAPGWRAAIAILGITGNITQPSCNTWVLPHGE